MPIAFPSISHGPIPVGFFNIETDMLLMDRYFFFSTDFCAWVLEWTGAVDLSQDKRLVYTIQDSDMIGNLVNAIDGFEFTGFIGNVYKKFPFPENRAGFKQKPYGIKNRPAVETVISSFAVQMEMPIIFSRADQTIAFGDYVFGAKVFQDILGYVEAGGMPGWLNGEAPDYVRRMAIQATTAKHWLFG